MSVEGIEFHVSTQDSILSRKLFWRRKGRKSGFSDAEFRYRRIFVMSSRWTWSYAMSWKVHSLDSTYREWKFSQQSYIKTEHVDKHESFYWMLIHPIRIVLPRYISSCFDRQWIPILYRFLEFLPIKNELSIVTIQEFHSHSISLFFTQKEDECFIDCFRDYSLWTLYIDHRRIGSLRVGHEEVIMQIWLCRLDLFDTRGLEAQIWTNICDKYSSTGRWHAIPARRIEIRKELRGRVHSFSASFLPIRCGSFEFTARARAPKSECSNWIWATQDAKNEFIHVTREGINRSELTQGMVRQLAQWFDNLLICWHMHDRRQSRENDESNLSMKHSNHNLTAFVAAFLSVIALLNGIDVSVIWSN